MWLSALLVTGRSRLSEDGPERTGGSMFWGNSTLCVCVHVCVRVWGGGM